MTSRTYTASDWLAALDEQLQAPPTGVSPAGETPATAPQLRPWQTFGIIAAVTQAPGALLLWGIFGAWWVVALALAAWLLVDLVILLAAWRMNRL